jgi:hypothetical protein
MVNACESRLNGPRGIELVPSAHRRYWRRGAAAWSAAANHRDLELVALRETRF